MKRIFLTLFILALGVLACGQYVTPIPASMIPASIETLTASPPPLPSASPRPPATDEQTAKVTAAAVYVHIAADVRSEVVGYVYAGMDVVTLSCAGDYCRLEQPFGYVWRGCLSDNPNQLRCEAKE